MTDQEKIQKGIDFLKAELEKGNSLIEGLGALKVSCTDEEIFEISRQFKAQRVRERSNKLLKGIVPEEEVKVSPKSNFPSIGPLLYFILLLLVVLLIIFIIFTVLSINAFGAQ